jgi:cytoskeletal protein CcmA (bactofilin family)
MFFNRKAKKSPSGARSNSAKAAQSEPSFISRECSIDGHVNCEGEIHIDGVVRGSVNAQTCVIEVAGVVHGEVSGDAVHVQGRVLGPIHGRNVYIYQGAHVEGEVLHDTISIENGAYLYGTVRHNAAPPAQQQQPQQQPKPRTFGSPFDQMAAPEGFDSLLSDQQLEQPAGAEIKKFPPQQRLK